jgi:MoxR-like ATPase
MFINIYTQIYTMTDHSEYLRIHLAIAEELGKYYINSTPVFTLGDLEMSVQDIMVAAVLSATNTYLIGTRGSGKTLLAETVWKSVMGADALYLRGSQDLDLKGLYTALNLEGKSEEEIYQISSRKFHPLVIVDELNRCIPIVQNQFLNIADGYIEIRGEKVKLGQIEQNYLMMIATGNPPNNGDDAGIFDEGIALIDRIGLIINVNDYPLADNDTATIKQRKISKGSIQEHDAKPDVMAGHGLIREYAAGMSHYFAILAAYIERRFRHFTVGGRTYDKTQVENWREMLQAGSHARGDKIAFASDISERALQESSLAEALLLYYHGFKAAEGEAVLSPQILVDCYLETLMLAMRYNRRFLPLDHIREEHHGDAREYLDKVRQSLRSEINPDTLEECAGMNLAAEQSMKEGKPQELQEYKGYVEGKFGTDPIAATTKRILEQKMRERLAKERKENVRQKLRGK